MRKIYLIAGHSKTDSGAVGNGYKEADLTQEFRDMIWRELYNLDCSKSNIIVTDEDDKALGVVIAEINKTATKDCIVCDIHFNAATPAATGTEVIIEELASVSEFEMNLAKDIVGNMAFILGIKNRGVKDESKTARQRLGIMRIKANVILLEVCFISNKSDMESYQANKTELSKAIAQILLSYYNKLQ